MTIKDLQKSKQMYQFKNMHNSEERTTAYYVIKWLDLN